MTKKNKKLILLFMIILIFIMVIIFFPVPCIFKKIFSIPCPGCGLTRSFKAIINLEFFQAFKYNILGIPLFILLLIVFTTMIFDLINKSSNLEKIYNRFLSKYYLIIIFILISWIINLLTKV